MERIWRCFCSRKCAVVGRNKGCLEGGDEKARFREYGKEVKEHKTDHGCQRTGEKTPLIRAITTQSLQTCTRKPRQD